MKVICQIPDEIEDADLILLGRAIASLRRDQPGGLGAIGYEGSKFEAHWKKNKSSYSVWCWSK